MPTLLASHATEIGGLPVRRVLPNHPVRMVGPFVFFDHMGPATVAPDDRIDVLPHPHIGLATVTYLFDGAMVHRDSLGSVQTIEPGDVNWMTAGRGIVHSERRPQGSVPAAVPTAYRLEGLQVWVGLPQAQEACEPAFDHYPASSLPVMDDDGIEIKLIAGAYFGMNSPVRTASPLGYAAVRLPAGRSLVVPPEHAERAVYCVDGGIHVDGTIVPPAGMLVLDPGRPAVVTAVSDARLMLPAGEPLDGPRFIEWNFVSSDRAALARAREDWQAHRFATIPGDDRERIEQPPRRGPR
jgi:redox-sensitive bicupin YhaK (pirin superfamily)